jgi:protein phosphatase methylesterase 1
VPSAKLDVRVYYTPPRFAAGTLMICHHGAGYSGLSFACLAKEVADMTMGQLGVLAMDARGHGKSMKLPVLCEAKRILGKTTSVEPQADGDLSVEVLTQDLFDLIRTIFPDPAIAHSLLVRPH